MSTRMCGLVTVVLAVGMLSPVAEVAHATPPVAIADGVLKDAHGAPLAGRHVDLFIWPAVEAVNVGDSVTLTMLSSTMSDKAGHFALATPAAAAIAPHAAPDGIVNFEVISGAGVSQFGGRLVNGVVVDATADPAPGNSRSALVSHADVQLPDAAATATPAAAGDPYYPGCVARLAQDYGAKNSIVGQTNSKTTGISHDFTYTVGASSSLGIGYSVSGSYGSWSQSGTASKSSTSTWGFPVQGDNIARRYLTGWRYGKWEFGCSEWATNNHWFEARTTSFAGGTALTSVGFPGYRYCVNFLGGSDFTKADSKAYNFTTGVGISGNLGVNLSVQTGYSTQAKIHYHNKITTTRKLCGNGDYPSGNTSFVVATA